MSDFVTTTTDIEPSCVDVIPPSPIQSPGGFSLERGHNTEAHECA